MWAFVQSEGTVLLPDVLPTSAGPLVDHHSVASAPRSPRVVAVAPERNLYLITTKPVASSGAGAAAPTALAGAPPAGPVVEPPSPSKHGRRHK